MNNTTMHNWMTSLQIPRVHVAVGFEIDRIVLPAINMKADRIWLIVHDKAHEDKGDKFVTAIQSKLKDARIECLQTQADRIVSLAVIVIGGHGHLSKIRIVYRYSLQSQ